MLTFSITISDSAAQRVLNAFAESYGWEPGKETKEQFVKTQVIAYMKDVTTSHESRNASKTAGSQAEGKAKAEIIIT